MARPSGRPIREEVLTSASDLVQRVGVNGFSFGALASELGISAPSIHHHFRTKDDLVGAVVARYRADFAELVARIDDDVSADPVGAIIAFARLFDATAKRSAMCLCGSVASDWSAVGDTARVEVDAFFGDQRRWLRGRLADGVRAGAFVADLDVDETSRMLLATLEGAMLLARAGDHAAVPSEMARQLLGVIGA